MKPFTPPRWLTNPHLQTLGSVLIPRSITAFPSADRYFNLADGSQLVAECSWQTDRQNCLTIVIVHGLNGSTISSYTRGATSKAFTQGFNVIRLDMRNGGNREELSRKLYHAGQSDVLVTVINELINRDGLTRIGLIGFSFGGNIVLKAAGEWGNQPPPELIGIFGISPLVDLAAAANAVDNQAPAIYRRRMLRGLKTKLRRRNHLFPNSYDLAGLDKITTIRAYDDKFAPYNGFKDANDYYVKASSLPLLSKIMVPTLLLEADDDPVIPSSSFKDIQNEAVKVVITEHGGHAGFISAKKEGDPDHHWAENRAAEYFTELVAKLDSVA